MAAKQSAGTYSPTGYDPDYAPFVDGDFDTLEDAVRSTAIKVSRNQFSELVKKMNKAARAWKLYCDIHMAPTDKQESQYVESLLNAANRLLKVLNPRFDDLHDIPEFEGVDPAEVDCVPSDADRMQSTEVRNDGMPEAFPDDPTAALGASIPLALERVLKHFDRHYQGDRSEPRQFIIQEEALNELAIMIKALAAGASDRLAELQDGEQLSSKPFDGSLRADTRITLGDAKSPNHYLFLELVPIYVALFDRDPKVSHTSASKTHSGNDPSGPAVKFYQFVFDRLDAPRKGREAETISDWIKDWKADRKANS